MSKGVKYRRIIIKDVKIKKTLTQKIKKRNKITVIGICLLVDKKMYKNI